MEKQALLKNILIELNQLPEAYLQHWYDLIHTFREKLSKQEGTPGPFAGDDFDWDALVEEVMNSRKRDNALRLKRIEGILND